MPPQEDTQLLSQAAMERPDQSDYEISYESPNKFRKVIRPYIKPIVKAKDSTSKIVKKVAGIDMWDEAAQLVTNADIGFYFSLHTH